MGQVWYLIVSIPGLCPLSNFNMSDLLDGEKIPKMGNSPVLTYNESVLTIH